MISPFYSTLFSVLGILLPAFILPLLMRYIISLVVLARVKKLYLPRYVKNLHYGWTRKSDQEAVERIKNKVLKKLKYHFAFRFRFIEDIKEILLDIENMGTGDKKKESPEYRFTLKRGAGCFLLAFYDIYTEFAGAPWFKAIRNVKIKWLFRINRLKEFYTKFQQLPLIRKLIDTRILWKLLRLILIPLLGVPHALFYFFRSMAISIFYESFLRFLYAMLLMKVGYYALFLYGKGNSHLEHRLKRMPKKRLKEVYSTLKSIINPANKSEKSRHYAAAVIRYNSLLKLWNIAPDPGTSRFQEDFLGAAGKWLKRFLKSTGQAYRESFPVNQAKKTDDKQNILELFYSLGGCYYTKSDPFRELRIHEVLEAGYMAAVILIYKLISTPGINILADKITVNTLINVKDFASGDLVKAVAGNVKESYKYIRWLNVIRKAFNIARGAGGPYGLIFSLGSPILFGQLKDMLKDFLYHRAGRLILYTFESSIMKRQNDLNTLLW